MPQFSITGVDTPGIVRDLESNLVPANGFTDGRNISFDTGAVAKSKGFVPVFGSPQVNPSFITWAPPTQNPSWVYTDGRKVYIVKGTAHYNITRQDNQGNDFDYQSIPTQQWNSTFLHGVLLLNNGIDAPQQWAPLTRDTLLTDLINWPTGFSVKSIRAYKNFLMVMNGVGFSQEFGVVESPQRIAWSSPAQPGALPVSWDIGNPATQAGEYDLSETAGGIVDGLPLGEFFIIYKEYDTWIARFIGGASVFAFAQLLPDSGLLTKNCVTAFRSGHFVVTQNDIIVHSGQRGSEQSLLEGRMRDWLFSNLDETNFVKSFVMNTGRDIWFCFPQKGSSVNNLALIWNSENNSITLRDLPNVNHGVVGPYISPQAATGRTWDQETETWTTTTDIWQDAETLSSRNLRNPVFVSQATSEIILGETEYLNNETPYTSYVERTGFPYTGFSRGGGLTSDEINQKFIQWFSPIVDADAGTTLTVEVGAQDYLDGPVDWQVSYTYTVGTDFKVPCFFHYRYLAFKISNNSAEAWRVSSFRIDFEFLGDF